MEFKAIIGLGNPGRQYAHNRHNVGFRIVDELCQNHGGSWQKKENMEVAHITIDARPVILIKPQTFMNTSGKVIPWLAKQGVKAENIIVAHDELELPFGSVKMKVGGSAKGHNGLKSIIEQCGPDFARLRFGIGRPQEREQVPNYVLQDFSESTSEVERLIANSANLLEKAVSSSGLIA